ncbi:MAG: LON peptidase substrate-binding domain-containing protein [Shewanella sp.]
MKIEAMSLFSSDMLILPRGRREIRVVQPQHLVTIVECLKLQQQLAIAMESESNPPCYPIATQCHIIDFNQLADNSLSIVVEGIQRVRVVSSMKQKDGRFMLHTLPSQHWQSEPLVGEYHIVSLALQEFFKVHPDLFDLYGDTHLQDASWVSERWLELLPMYNSDKHQLLSQPDCHKTMNFVLSLIQHEF